MLVDFDNVYTDLMVLDPAAAKRFAEYPKHRTETLADGGVGVGEESWRFLIRNCYLNPAIYSKYRPNWNRAGFRVIGCPPSPSGASPALTSTWCWTRWIPCPCRAYRGVFCCVSRRGFHVTGPAVTGR